MSEKLTVAELLARNGRGSSDGSGNRPRRRRRNLEEGGLSVAELTGNIPVVTREDVEQHKAKEVKESQAAAKPAEKQAENKVAAAKSAEAKATESKAAPQKSEPKRVSAIKPVGFKPEKPGEQTGVMNAVPETAAPKKDDKQSAKKDTTFGDVVKNDKKAAPAAAKPVEKTSAKIVDKKPLPKAQGTGSAPQKPAQPQKPTSAPKPASAQKPAAPQPAETKSSAEGGAKEKVKGLFKSFGKKSSKTEQTPAPKTGGAAKKAAGTAAAAGAAGAGAAAAASAAKKPEAKQPEVKKPEVKQPGAAKSPVKKAELRKPPVKKAEPKTPADKPATKPINDTLIADGKAEADRKLLAEKKAKEQKLKDQKAAQPVAKPAAKPETKTADKPSSKPGAKTAAAAGAAGLVGAGATAAAKKDDKKPAPSANKPVAEKQPQKKADQKAATEQKRPVGVDGADKPKEFAELEASLADDEVIDYEDDTVSMPMMILQAVLAVAAGIGLFFVFSLLWANLPSVLVLALALVVTLVLVGAVHFLLRHKDKLLMVLAFFVGLLLTIGPRLVMGL